MNCCKNPKTGNFSSRRGDWSHVFCHACGAHYYNGKMYTKKEWQKWIDGDDTVDVFKISKIVANRNEFNRKWGIGR